MVIRKYKRLLKRKPIKTRVFYKRRKRANNKSLALGFIFFAVVIMLAIIVKITDSYFMYRINIKNVESFNIPAQEIAYIYEICGEQNKDFAHVLTAYCIYNKFFPEKRVAKTKEQIQAELVKTEKVRTAMSEKRYQAYYSVIDTLTSEAVIFPVNLTDSYMFGDTWGAKTCGTKNHKGTDIFDRENVNGSIAVKSMTNGVISDKGRAGGTYYIGITTGKGAYFLYSNLTKIDGMEQGTQVAAGSILGYMAGGKSGPSKVHIGVKLGDEIKKGGIWINPYPILRYLETAVL